MVPVLDDLAVHDLVLPLQGAVPLLQLILFDLEHVSGVLLQEDSVLDVSLLLNGAFFR